MRQCFVLVLTFLCDINSQLIEGLHLLVALLTPIFILAALQEEGQGVKYTSHPAPLAVVTSTGLLHQSVGRMGKTNLNASLQGNSESVKRNNIKMGQNLVTVA
ncbi:hypothetical protein GOODEAATRI_006587 [Goodea atripinnis]|uniref:Uncharacterized protein n=1 Tax=Goodea atripinnis TaxID=208336 RepID=A0ABV0PVT2_9TELE